jgi:hypothetical protein
MSENCANKLPCGCADQALETVHTCESDTTACPNPDPCPETFSAGCNIWTGADIICNSTVVAREGMTMQEIIATMVALFCGPQTPPTQDFNLLHPFPDASIIAPDDQIICVDRINCFDDLVVSIPESTTINPVPSESSFTWTDIAGTEYSEVETMTIEGERSCIIFSFNYNSTIPGTYNFNLIITGCGTTVEVPVSLVIT